MDLISLVKKEGFVQKYFSAYSRVFPAALLLPPNLPELAVLYDHGQRPAACRIRINRLAYA
jgi:hypothetical protein